MHPALHPAQVLRYVAAPDAEQLHSLSAADILATVHRELPLVTALIKLVDDHVQGGPWAVAIHYSLDEGLAREILESAIERHKEDFELLSDPDLFDSVSAPLQPCAGMLMWKDVQLTAHRRVPADCTQACLRPSVSNWPLTSTDLPHFLVRTDTAHALACSTGPDRARLGRAPQRWNAWVAGLPGKLPSEQPNSVSLQNQLICFNNCVATYSASNLVLCDINIGLLAVSATLQAALCHSPTPAAHKASPDVLPIQRKSSYKAAYCAAVLAMASVEEAEKDDGQQARIPDLGTNNKLRLSEDEGLRVKQLQQPNQVTQ